MFKMLRDVQNELIRVNNNQILPIRKGSQGSILAMKVQHGDKVSYLAQMKVSDSGNATGRTFYVESDCLVEVISDA